MSYKITNEVDNYNIFKIKILNNSNMRVESIFIPYGYIKTERCTHKKEEKKQKQGEH